MFIIAIGLFIAISVLSIKTINSKFTFNKETLIIPHGTYGEKLTLKQRTIKIDRIIEAFAVIDKMPIPHLVISCRRKKYHVNMILFSKKRILKIVEYINEIITKDKSDVIEKE